MPNIDADIIALATPSSPGFWGMGDDVPEAQG